MSMTLDEVYELFVWEPFYTSEEYEHNRYWAEKNNDIGWLESLDEFKKQVKEL